MARLTWSVTARRDLRSIKQYVAFDSPRAAEFLVERIINVAKRLEDFPDLGRVVPGFNDDSLRELIYENYRIVYRIRARGPSIVRVVHSAMDIRRVEFGA